MNVAQHILVFLLRGYRTVISPAQRYVFGPMAGCRFTPSCSAYALEAVQTHGAWRGTWLAVRRVLRCHPWGGGGFDPVPPRSPKPRSAPTPPGNCDRSFPLQPRPAGHGAPH